MARSAALPLLLLLLGACGGDDDASADSSPHAGSSAQAGSTGSDGGSSGGASFGGASDAGSAGSGDAGSGAIGEACSDDALREPSAATTYYVAIGEPGADNDACDGLAPTDEGGGHCPFEDFDSERTLHLLDGVAGTRVELRTGTYVIHGWDGLPVVGTGQTEAERIVLSAYPGESPVLDVASPDGAGCDAMTAPDNPDCVRQVVRINGQHTVVQGLTIRNGLAYHLEVNGGAHHLVRCNTLGETVAFSMRSDCMKLDGNASDVEVSHNVFTRFRSQAIDMTNVADVLIEDNDFSDPVDDDSGATGSKYGARDVTIRGNRVHDMGASGMMHAFSLGGTGTDHPDDHLAYRLRLEGNRVWNIAGIVAQVVSCEDCAIVDNQVWNAGAGFLLSSSGTGRAECKTAASGGCGPSSGTQVKGNRMRELNGGGDAAQANVFVFVEPGEGMGLDAGDNLYCTSGSGAAQFGLEGMLVDFAAWTAGTGTEDGSETVPASDPRCAF